MNIKTDTIADALREVFVSPNELDSNWESSNVVDVLGKLSRAEYKVAEANEGIATALEKVAEALNGLAAAVAEGNGRG